MFLTTLPAVIIVCEIYCGHNIMVYSFVRDSPTVVVIIGDNYIPFFYNVLNMCVYEEKQQYLLNYRYK